MVQRVGVVLLALGPFGCFIPSGIDVDDFTGTDDLPWTDSLTGLTASTLDSGSTGPDSMSSTTVDPDSSTSAGESTTSDTDDPPMSVCDPQPEDVDNLVIVDGEIGGEMTETDIVTACAVTSVSVEDDMLHVGLACSDGVHTLDVTDVGPIDLSPGDEVELSLFVDAPWWANVFIALRRDGELVLAVLSAESLPEGDGHSPEEGFWSPLRPVALTQVCPDEPEEVEPCQGFICPPDCTRDRRLALAFFTDDDAEVIYDHGSGQLGDLAIVVDDAREHVEVLCTDTPGAFYEFIAVRAP
jgi:hypothetical protein